MNNEKLKSLSFIGAPLSFQNKLFIYPPILKQVLATASFDIYLSYFTMTQENVVDQITDYGRRAIEEKIPTPFELILILAESNPTLKGELEAGLFFFTHEKASIFPQQQNIVLGDINKAKSIDDLVIINGENFNEFQNMIRISLGFDPVNIAENENLDPRIQKMRAKARYRDYIKAKKSSKLSMDEILTAICCMGIGLTPLNIGEITYAAFTRLFRSSQKKEAYEWEMRLAISGNAAKKINPKYWIDESETK